MNIKRISDTDELKSLATEMKISACANGAKVKEKRRYFKDKEDRDRLLNNPEIVEYFVQSPLVQPIVFENRIVINLVLTVEALPDDQPETWHLSMSNILPPKDDAPNTVGRVPDSDAVIMANAFFDNFEEVPTESKIYPDIRDFVSQKAVVVAIETKRA